MEQNCFVTLAIKSFGKDQITTCRADQGFDRQKQLESYKKESKYIVWSALVFFSSWGEGELYAPGT